MAPRRTGGSAGRPRAADRGPAQPARPSRRADAARRAEPRQRADQGRQRAAAAAVAVRARRQAKARGEAWGGSSRAPAGRGRGRRRVKPTITMRRALKDPKLFGPILKGPSWLGWRALLIASMGEKLTAEEREAFARLTGRLAEPGERVDEFWAIVGRRGG